MDSVVNALSSTTDSIVGIGVWYSWQFVVVIHRIRGAGSADTAVRRTKCRTAARTQRDTRKYKLPFSLRSFASTCRLHCDPGGSAECIVDQHEVSCRSAVTATQSTPLTRPTKPRNHTRASLLHGRACLRLKDGDCASVCMFPG